MKKKMWIIVIAAVLAVVVIGVIAMGGKESPVSNDPAPDTVTTEESKASQQTTEQTQDTAQSAEAQRWEQIVGDFAGIYSRGSQKFAMIVEPMNEDTCYIGLTESGIEGEYPCQYEGGVLAVDLGDLGQLTLTLRQDGSLELQSDSPALQDAVGIYFM